MFKKALFNYQGFLWCLFCKEHEITYLEEAYSARFVKWME